MAATIVTLNDLERYSSVAGFSKCNPSNICAAFYTISTDSVLARFLCISRASWFLLRSGRLEHFLPTFTTLLIPVLSENDSTVYFLIVLTTDYCWRSWTCRIAALYKYWVDWLIDVNVCINCTFLHLFSIYPMLDKFFVRSSMAVCWAKWPHTQWLHSTVLHTTSSLSDFYRMLSGQAIRWPGQQSSVIRCSTVSFSEFTPSSMVHSNSQITQC